MPRPLIYVGLVLVVLTLLPVGWLVRAQFAPQHHPRLQVVPDMDNQPKLRTQAGSTFFADGRAMRLPVDGTIARGALREDAAWFEGKVGEQWVATNPLALDADLLARGRQRFDIYCAPCHGAAGRGDGLVHRRASALAEGTWTQPADLTAPAVRDQADGQIYGTISHGIRTMPGYATQIEVRDRWAIVAYVRALERSAHGRSTDVPDDARASLR